MADPFIAFLQIFAEFVPRLFPSQQTKKARPDRAEGEPRSVRRAATAAKAMRFKKGLAGYFASCKVG